MKFHQIYNLGAVGAEVNWLGSDHWNTKYGH